MTETLKIQTEGEEVESRPNPISRHTRDVLYILGIIVGSLAVVVGPLIVALEVPDAWAAVIVSAVGAVTSLLSLLARAYLTPPYEPRH